VEDAVLVALQQVSPVVCYTADVACYVRHERQEMCAQVHPEMLTFFFSLSASLLRAFPSATSFEHITRSTVSRRRTSHKTPGDNINTLARQHTATSTAIGYASLNISQSWEAKLAMSRVTDFSSDPRLGAYQRMLPPEEPKIKDPAPLASSSASAGPSTGNGQVVSRVVVPLIQWLVYTTLLLVLQDEDVKPAVASTSKAEPSSSTATPSASTSNTPALSTSTSASAKPNTAADPNSNEINSDLDDSADEDLFSDDDEDGGENGSANGLGGGSEDRGDVIIALYEKVQRVKNK